MKAKRMVAMFAAAALSTAMCLSLAACGESGNDDEKQPEQGTVVTPVTPDTPDTPDTPETPETLISDRVTKEEWDKAFSDESFANVRVEMTSAANARWHDEDMLITGTSEYSSLYIAADGKESFKLSGSDVEKSADGTTTYHENEKRYSVIEKVENEINRYIIFNNVRGEEQYPDHSSSWGGKWSFNRSEENIRSEFMWYTIGFGYEMFAYSEEAGAYIATNTESYGDGSGMDMVFTVKIKDGRLMYFDHSYVERGAIEGDDGTDGETYTFQYGGQSVEISEAPTVKDVCGRFVFYELDGRYHADDILPNSKLELTEDYMTYTFREDGTVTATSQGVEQTGTYQVSDFIITVTVGDTKREIVWADDNEITYTQKTKVMVYDTLEDLLAEKNGREETYEMPITLRKKNA